MPDWRRHITSDPEICHGRPCVKGTRIMVTVVLDNLAEGSTTDEIIAAYPTLRHDDIQAVIAYAAEMLRDELHFLPGTTA